MNAIQRYGNIKKIWQRLRKKGQPWQNRYWANNTLSNFKRHVKRTGIKPVGALNIHTLRKNACQNWADQLPMNVTKEFMGHADMATMQEFYSQVDKHHERIATDGIQTILVDAEQKTEKKDVCGTYKPALTAEKR